MIYRKLLGLFVAISILVTGCTTSSDEALIDTALSDIMIAIESRKTGNVMMHLADNFSGPDNMDKRQARQYLTATLLRYRNIRLIKTSPIEIQLQNQNAIASFSVSVSNGPGLIPDQLRLYTVTTGWQKIDGDWKMLQAKWTTR